MTLTIAWVRDKIKNPELIMVSDSRLTSGGNVDYCQKIFPLPRGDCAIGFCGNTMVAYPFVLQLMNYISSYSRANDRALDVSDLRTNITKLLNQFMDQHEAYLSDDLADTIRSTSFLFCGWSWKQNKYVLYSLRPHGSGVYECGKSRVWKHWGLKKKDAKQVMWIGDYRADYSQDLQQRLSAKGPLADQEIDMEPFEVLRDMLCDDVFTDRELPNKGLIGGSLQMIKVYPYSKVLPFGVRWKDDHVHLFGRRLLPFEKIPNPVIDPTSLKIKGAKLIN